MLTFARSLPASLMLVTTLMAQEPARPQERPIRVLLMANVAGREYQFLRTALQRPPADAKFRCSQMLQGIGDRQVQGIVERGPDKILTTFPDHLSKVEDDRPEQVPFNLAAYDVLVVFDLDWLQVTVEQQELLKKWVEKGGSLIFLAGAVNTPLLASPRHRKHVATLRELFPVVVADARLRFLDEPPGVRPHRLQFTRAAQSVEALRLGQNDLAPAWEPLFGKNQGEPERGFFHAFPVDSVKPESEVLATFGKDVPYLVRSKVGAGQVLYVGGAELYRLREVRTDLHEQLWCGLLAQLANRPK